MTIRAISYANALIQQARVGTVESLKTFAKRHGLDIEDRTDARALKRAIRTSRGTITHRQLLRRLNRVSAKAVKRKAGLSSIASRAKGRAPSLQSIVREVHAYRRAKRAR